MTVDTSQLWIVILIALFAGLMFGFALHPGGKRWRGRYDDEVAKRREAETRVTALEKELRDERARHPIRADEVRYDGDGKPTYISDSDAKRV